MSRLTVAEVDAIKAGAEYLKDHPVLDKHGFTKDVLALCAEIEALRRERDDFRRELGGLRREHVAAIEREQDARAELLSELDSILESLPDDT